MILARSPSNPARDRPCLPSRPVSNPFSESIIGRAGERPPRSLENRGDVIWVSGISAFLLYGQRAAARHCIPMREASPAYRRNQLAQRRPEYVLLRVGAIVNVGTQQQSPVSTVSIPVCALSSDIGTGRKAILRRNNGFKIKNRETDRVRRNQFNKFPDGCEGVLTGNCAGSRSAPGNVVCFWIPHRGALLLCYRLLLYFTDNNCRRTQYH